MPDYRKGVIYKIETGGELYVGSTCNYTKRKYTHNRAINFKGSNCNAKLYNTIRENGGEWRMIPIKEFPCESKLQLTIEEEKWRKELGATLNSHWCYCTDVERREKKSKTHKQYYQDNKEKISEQGKQYREQNKEKISERDKHYYEKTRDKRLQKVKQYSQENKEKISERQNQKIECPICGSMVSYRHMARHKRSAKCKATSLQME